MKKYSIQMISRNNQCALYNKLQLQIVGVKLISRATLQHFILRPSQVAVMDLKIIRFLTVYFIVALPAMVQKLKENPTILKEEKNYGE